MGLGFIMYIGFMLPRGYYFECFVSVLIYFLVVYHCLSCMFKDPGIIPRPPDYIKKKAEWEVEAKKKREEANERRIEEAKKRAKEYDPEDTPIPMNETISTDPGNPEPIELQKLPREEIMTKTSKPDEESKTPQNAKIEDINAN